MLDQTDFHILSLLKKNSRIQWREIGELVHLTGQAVANRIRRMEDLGVIEGYTINLNQNKLGKNLIAFITVFMKTTDHLSFQNFIKEKPEVLEGNRISGDGCYLLKVNVSNEEELMNILDEILSYGNYRVNISIGKIK
ncbi:Lrp/AsnC family transcriptional regulator [Clostridium sp. DJ247]|uniref:Lrp/AsnC family transcriptional regulator n=1 Tax=Clostridium sp. DJ247 TaxID=2726188 RepID=UPI00162A91E8|nr:Lrp/AsnC family transcriptional regulator [Clostridium sp. DJ247]MBC2578831.1 Lrp/AsnC family transcriptional regulator [Clostridium sp. DJ247]